LSVSGGYLLNFWLLWMLRRGVGYVGLFFGKVTEGELVIL
jgi:hypothetical protein